MRILTAITNNIATKRVCHLKSILKITETMNASIPLVCTMLFISLTAFGQFIDQAKALFENRQYDQVRKMLSPIKEDHPNFAASQYYLGRVAFEEKKFDDAVDYFEEATEGSPKDGDYFMWLGDAYSAAASKANVFKQMSLGPKALKALEKATQLDSKNIDARLSLVEFYRMAPGFMGGGDDKSDAIALEAFVLIDEALKKTPDHRLYLYGYGKSSAITGLKLERGETCLKKYLTFSPIEGEPSLAGAYMRLGQIKEKQGSKAEAKKYFEMALKLDSKMKSAQEGLERTSK
jgi:tetratricopeptide (TPR) repeat protein